MLEVVNMIEIQGRDVEMSSLCKEERKEIGMKLHIQAMSKLGYKPKVKNDKTAWKRFVRTSFMYVKNNSRGTGYCSSN